MDVKTDAANIDNLLEYVGPCAEELPPQPDWNSLGDRGVDDLVSGLVKLADPNDFLPKPMGPPKSYVPPAAASTPSGRTTGAASRRPAT